jgi:hypothetical protein
MSLGPLALAFVFLAVAFSFRSTAAKAKDEKTATNTRFASTMMFMAAAGFLVAAIIPVLT